MGLLTKDIRSLDDLLLQVLGELRYTERRIERELAGLAGKLSDTRLQDEVQVWVDAAQIYGDRIEDVFRLNGAKPRLSECPAIDGIFIAAGELNDEIADDELRDAAILGAVESVAAYAISRYATVVEWFRQSGRAESARVLQETLAGRRQAAVALRGRAERCRKPKGSRQPGTALVALAG